MKGITIFSWGYFGWGNATKQLLQAFDAAEKSRGFGPPIFVDIRKSRAVRAKGFQGNRFSTVAGDDRYRWMKELGNEAITNKSIKRQIKITDPLGVNDLLYIAREAAQQQRRVVFFCACEIPGRCHRTLVSRLAVSTAKKRGIPVEVVEWPGGQPGHMHREVGPELFRSLLSGRMRIPLGSRPDLSVLSGVPWWTAITLTNRGRKTHRLVGPATYGPSGWFLPVTLALGDSEATLSQYREAGAKRRKFLGYEARRST